MKSGSVARAIGALLLALLAACAQPPRSAPPAAPAAIPFQTEVDATGPRPWTHDRFARGDGYFRFAVIGDRTGAHRAGVFEAALERLTWLQPEFVVGVGNLIEGYSEDPTVLQRQWSEVHGQIDRLPMPFFLTVGNHDVGNATMLDDWLRRHGRTYYHFVYDDALFLVLDTEDPPQLLDRAALDSAALDSGALDGLARTQAPARLPAAISSRQIAWLETVLQRYREVRWTFVFMHKPAWLGAGDEFNAIEDLLAGRRYTVFAGHGHVYQHSVRHGQDYIRLGPAGAGTPAPEGVDQVTLVTMTPAEPRIANITLPGVFPKEGPAPPR